MTISYAKTINNEVSADLRKTALDPNFWYPVARSRKLKENKTLAVSFAGEPIVLFRAQNGAVGALENRCAHRQVPLDRGVVRGDCLQCTYHGWIYNSEGRCISVPYLKSQESYKAGIKSYPCMEAYGLIFIFPGEKDATELPLPSIPTFADPKYKTRYLDRQVNCHYSFMHENLMDMNHQFLHRKLMGSIRTRFLELRRDEDKVEVDYSFFRTQGRQSFGEKFMIGIRSPKRVKTKQDLMTITTEYPYQRLRYWPPGGDTPALDLWNVYIPVDREQRINHTFGLMNIQRPPIPGMIHLLWPAIIWFTEGIFAEDREIVELEQKAFDTQGSDWNQEIFPVIKALRHLLRSHGVPMYS